MNATALPQLRTALVCGALLLGGSGSAAAQLDPDNLPRPPREALAALERFFGYYEHSDQVYAGLGPWNGTLDVGPTIKGWYVEFVINTRFGPIDRQLRMLTTWDEALGRYRVWRFETYPQSPPGTVEADGWFDGDDFIMEWRDTRGPDGGRGIFRNRISMKSPDELVIETRVAPDWGDPIRLGTWSSRRIGDADQKPVFPNR